MCNPPLGCIYSVSVQFGQNINIKGVTVNLPRTPKMIMEEVAKAAGYATTEELLKDPKFKTAFEDFFWGETEKGH